MGKIILNDIEYGIGISNGVNVDTTNLVKKDSIVTTLDDTVTDKQIPSAKAVYDKLSDLPTDSGLKCYTTLNELGLTADATVEDVIDALPIGGTALLRTDAFTNWSTLFNGIQWGYLKVEKTINDLSNIELQEVVTPNRRYFGTQSSGKFNKWQQVASEITDVLDNRSNFNQTPNANLVAREIYGKFINTEKYSDALTIPAGKWRVDSNNKAKQIQNLPVQKAGILEVKYLHGNDGNTSYTGTYKYAMLTYTAISGEKYERSFNSDGTIGNIVNDTGWRTVIIENSLADPYSCAGYKALTGTEDLFTLAPGHYVSANINTTYNYPITDSTQLTAHIYVLGHLNDPTNNKGYRIILYFDNKNRMYRINEWWGVFTDNGWQNMQAIGNGGNSDVYSTSEQAIGTWVDGKTIYRKTIVKDKHGANEQLISGVDTFIRGYGTCERAGYVYNVPHCGLLAGHLQDEDVPYLNFKLDTNGALSTIGSSTYTISKLKVTLEYTKR